MYIWSKGLKENSSNIPLPIYCILTIFILSLYVAYDVMVYSVYGETRAPHMEARRLDVSSFKSVKGHKFRLNAGQSYGYWLDCSSCAGEQVCEV